MRQRPYPCVVAEIGCNHKGDMAIVLVEQYFDFAKELADRFIVLERGEVVEFGLKQDTLMLLELFKTPRPVRQALSAIKQYIRTLPEQTLRELLISLSESRNVQDFIEQSDNIALFKIRQWLCRGILSVA